MRRFWCIAAALIAIGMVLIAVETLNMGLESQSLVPGQMGMSTSQQDESWWRLAWGIVLLVGGFVILLQARPKS